MTEGESAKVDKGKGPALPMPPPPAEAVQEAAKMLEDGRALMKTDLDAAIEKIGAALEKQVALVGELALETAEFYYMYGHALLTKVENETDPLGDAVGKPSDEGNDPAAPPAKAAPAPPPKEQPLCGDLLSIEDGSDGEDGAPRQNRKGKQPAEPAPQPEEEDDENGEGEGEGGAGEGEGEESSDDMQIAWENLDAARSIWENHSTGQEVNLARVHLRLGDHCLEGEKFGEAVEEFSHALAIRRKLLGENDRQLMDCYHGLMMAHQMGGDVEKAIEQCEAAIALARRRVAELAGGASGAAGADAGAAAEEVEDLKFIIEGLEEKRKELEESAKQDVREAIAEAVRSVSGGMPSGVGPSSSSANGAGPSSAAAAPAAASPAKPVVTEGFDAPSAAAATGPVNDMGVIGRGVKRTRPTPAAPSDSPAGAAAPASVPATTVPAEPSKKKGRLEGLMEGSDTQIGF